MVALSIAPQASQAVEAIALETIRAVWAAVLPHVPFDLHSSWSDLGVNSLKAIEIVLRLEQVSGRPIGFDGMTAESTAADLLASLTAGQAASAPDDVRPLVFLVPGIFGDDRHLAQLRRALRPKIRFRTLDLPGVEAPSRALRTIPTIAEHILEEVAARAPNGCIHLAGYSFGGLVAQEMARQIEGAGRSVGLLCVFDGLLHYGGERAATTIDRVAPPRLRDVWRGRAKQGMGAVARGLAPIDMGKHLAIGAGRRNGVSATVHEQGRRRALRLRQAAALGWRPRACRAPTLLVTSDDFAAWSSIEAWRAACPRLTVVPVPGGHLDVFEPEAVAAFTPAFLDGLSPTEATCG